MTKQNPTARNANRGLADCQHGTCSGAACTLDDATAQTWNLTLVDGTTVTETVDSFADLPVRVWVDGAWVDVEYRERVTAEDTEQLAGNAQPTPPALHHGDYMTYHLHCASLTYADLRPGDVVWAPSDDSFNPWREMVEILEAGPTGWCHVAEVRGNGVRYGDKLRWFPTSTLFYAARNTHEVELAGGVR